MIKKLSFLTHGLAISIVLIISQSSFGQSINKDEFLKKLESYLAADQQSSINSLKKDGFIVLKNENSCSTLGKCSDKSNCHTTIEICSAIPLVTYTTTIANQFDLLKCELSLGKYQTQSSENYRVYEATGLRYTFMENKNMNDETIYTLYIKKL